MPKKPSKCICYGKPRLRGCDAGWYAQCACGRQTLAYKTKEEAVDAWNHRICNERGAANG